MRRFAYIMAMITIFMAFGLILYLGILQLYPFEVVTLRKNPLPITYKTVRPGEEQCILLDYYKNYPFRADIEYYIEDGQVFTLRSHGVYRDVGRGSVTRCFTIPLTLHPGKYAIKVNLIYHPTAFRLIPYTWESEKFEVVKGGVNE